MIEFRGFVVRPDRVLVDGVRLAVGLRQLVGEFGDMRLFDFTLTAAGRQLPVRVQATRGSLGGVQAFQMIVADRVVYSEN
jgi:hypothetical protein